MLAHRSAVCDAASHEESKTDPEGYGLRVLGPGCGGVFFECPHCPSTLFISGYAKCETCRDTGEVEYADAASMYDPYKTRRCPDCNPVVKGAY